MRKNIDTFLWYDLETYGLNTQYDRIAQFAAIRTDYNLNIIEEPLVYYCKVSKDYLPEVEACLVTKITPEEANEKGYNEAEFAKLIYKEFTRPHTCIAGFNNLNFDDECIRNLFYRNFYHSYEFGYKNGNSRFDLLNLVRACYDFKRDSIKWPEKKENGNPSFKLTDLTEANNISHINAHDALSDVYATIAVAKLIKEKEPKLFEYALSLRNKETVKNIATKKMFLYTKDIFTSNVGCTKVVKYLPICDPLDSSAIYFFDLSNDPTQLINAKGDEIFKTIGLSKLKTNKNSFVTPLSILKTPKLIDRLAIDLKLCKKHSDLIDKSKVYENLSESISNKDIGEKIEDVDFQIYSGGFFTNPDLKKFEYIRNAKPELLLSENWKILDPRFKELIKRYACRNFLEYQSMQVQEDWKEFCRNRIVHASGNAKNNLTYFNNRLNEAYYNKSDLTSIEKQVLDSLKNYRDSLIKELSL